MKQTVIVGVDVSKATLDVFIRPSMSALRIDNNKSGFRQLLKTLKQQGELGSVMVVMEHTGKYSLMLEKFLWDHAVSYCKIAALQIKRSMGMVRGKNDKVDAERICEYGWLRRELLVADQWPSETISQLKEWLGLRSKLVSDRAGYVCRLKELKSALHGNTGCKELIRIHEQMIAKLTEKIKEAEGKIGSIIKSNEALRQTQQLLRSIKGVGFIVAASMISCTDNFKRFSNARKFNCYAGLAPFKHESGSSIRGRSRVSHLANKGIKWLLNLAASTAIQHNPELKTYYKRRVAEGKKKMSCLNIVRAKLVARMFAIIKRQTPYQPLAIAA